MNPLRQIQVTIFGIIIATILVANTEWGGIVVPIILAAIILAVILRKSKPIDRAREGRIEEHNRRVMEEKETKLNRMSGKTDSQPYQRVNKQDVSLKSGLKGSVKWYIRYIFTRRISE